MLKLDESLGDVEDCLHSLLISVLVTILTRSDSRSSKVTKGMSLTDSLSLLASAG